jgi:hypothetical protein
MHTESTQINNFIDAEFVEPVPFLVIPSEVEEALDVSARSSL